MTHPAFIVVLDAGDDARLTHAALNAHDPRHGVLTVHPTPATTAASALAHDFLAALGRPITGLGEVATAGLRPAWSAVTGWIVGDGIKQVLVLRAHLFREAQWHRLIELHEATGAAMLVFCHSTAVPQPARQVLAEIPTR